MENKKQKQEKENKEHIYKTTYGKWKVTFYYTDVSIPKVLKLVAKLIKKIILVKGYTKQCVSFFMQNIIEQGIVNFLILKS